MIELTVKVLKELVSQKKKKVRHSEKGFTVRAYRMLNRSTDTTYIRVDIYRTEDMA